jgi:hypothetical protein
MCCRAAARNQSREEKYPPPPAPILRWGQRRAQIQNVSTRVHPILPKTFPLLPFARPESGRTPGIRLGLIVGSVMGPITPVKMGV